MTRRACDTGWRIYAWAVEVPQAEPALFRDRARAVAYATAHHGIVVPLFDLR